jgi:hypothetical protein
MTRWITGLGGFALAFTVAVAAQAQPAAPLPITPEKLALAQQVVDSADIVRTMAMLMDAVMKPFAQQLNAGSGPPELKSYMVDLLHSEITSMEVRMEPLYAQIYARTFDERQLADILAFYRSPTGRVMVEKQPELSREGQLAVAPLIPQMQRDLVEKLFAHICEMQKCTPDQRQQLEAAKAQVLAKFGAQSPVPATPPAQ